jgi:hypothetical protein
MAVNVPARRLRLVVDPATATGCKKYSRFAD